VRDWKRREEKRREEKRREETAEAQRRRGAEGGNKLEGSRV
jgi:hypothetical protein